MRENRRPPSTRRPRRCSRCSIGYRRVIDPEVIAAIDALNAAAAAAAAAIAGVPDA